MRQARILWHLVKADFLTRVRRTSFLLTMGFTLYVGYETFAGHIVLRLGDYRGVYNSAWVGALMGIVTSSLLSLAGFYIVKGSILRDEQTRVGQILAATPMSKSFYTVAKWMGNFVVLASMVGVMAVAAVCMQLLRGEERTLHWGALVGPLAFLALPAMAFVAALAVLWETVPVLRGGVGNVVYFFAWSSLLSLGIGAVMAHAGPVQTRAYFQDFTGMPTLMNQMRSALVRVDPGFQNEFSLTIASGVPLKRFVWNGMVWSGAQVAARLAWVGYGLLAVLLAKVFFHRFDPARMGARAWMRGGWRRRAETSLERAEVIELKAARGLAQQSREGWRGMLTPVPRGEEKTRFFALVAAELRLMLQGQKWWWYAGAAGLFVGCLAAPLNTGRTGVLVAAWLWPLLLWAPMGNREARWSTESLVYASPHALGRQLPAAWLAGVVVAMATGGGLAIRLGIAGDGHGLIGWAVGACFIPSLALACGVWSGGSKLFEALYTVWWYAGALHHAAGLDYTGVVASSARPGVYAGLTLMLLGAAWMGRRAKLAYA
ncbi:MAG TPA: hypothetical protein VHU89_18835 [Acidobacteriaceae bacterium]|jgi:hypothetical protein|nr:hypothetical protein [Acidobacteriaceae bacterium]